MAEEATRDQSRSRQAGRTLKPQDAATLVIVDTSSGEPRMLMGRRRPDQLFLPNKYVFPGGRIDKADRLVASFDELRPVEMAKLLIGMKGSVSVSRARALALGALRETFEEAGVLIGERNAAAAEIPSLPPWRDFLSQGFLPKLSALTFFARAITPPGRPRRYDTRFFYIDAAAIAHRVDTRDGELSSLDWFSFDEMKALDLPPITRVILEDLGDHLKAGCDTQNAPVPFYFHRSGTFRRELLEVLDP